jgi:hypothetical protein
MQATRCRRIRWRRSSRLGEGTRWMIIGRRIRRPSMDDRTMRLLWRRRNWASAIRRRRMLREADALPRPDSWGFQFIFLRISFIRSRHVLITSCCTRRPSRAPLTFSPSSSFRPNLAPSRTFFPLTLCNASQTSIMQPTFRPLHLRHFFSTSSRLSLFA